jgi:DNA-binding YbaB/EbfC family protein
MKNFVQMMKQAQQMQNKMQGKMAEMQERLATIEVSGQSGGGLVTVTLNCKGELKQLKIDKSLVNPSEVEIIEDLIIAAFNDAKTKVELQVQEETAKLMEGVQLPPGIKLPL